MKRKIMATLGLAFTCPLALLAGLTSAQTAVADTGFSHITTVSETSSVNERAEALGLKLEGGAVPTASKSYSLKFPNSLTAINGIAQLDLSRWEGYTFALDDATQWLYISNSHRELVGLVTEFYGSTIDGEVSPAKVILENNMLRLSSESDNVVKYRLDYFDATVPSSTESAGQWRASLIKVPSNYVYNPKLGSLHDYCTKSPDEFPNPFGSNADFRGPCAIHDMCYERKGCASKACDAALLVNLGNNCIATYSKGATQSSCMATAGVYYSTVTAVHVFSSCP